MSKKADSGLADERPFWGVHILATAMLCAKGSSADELELARRLLARDPRVDALRENESVAGAFNRHMDAALDSANDSLGDPSRASRRAMLARDLDRAGLVLMDRAQVADLIGAINALREELADAATGEDFGAELLDDDPCDHPPEAIFRVPGPARVFRCGKCASEVDVDREEIRGFPRTGIWIDEASDIPQGLIDDLASRGELNPNVND